MEISCCYFVLALCGKWGNWKVGVLCSWGSGVPSQLANANVKARHSWSKLHVAGARRREQQEQKLENPREKREEKRWRGWRKAH